MYEISYISAVFSCAMRALIVHHKHVLKHVLSYLSGLRDASLTYSRYVPLILDVYSDYDWDVFKKTRKSHTGYPVSFSGDLVYWRSTIQPSVALLFAED